MHFKCRSLEGLQKLKKKTFLRISKGSSGEYDLKKDLHEISFFRKISKNILVLGEIASF